MQPEEYDEFGEIIPPKPKQVVYERLLTEDQQHRIHETKDLFEGSCSLCQKDSQKRQAKWDRENNL
jgi:hypothetical protein